MKKKIVAKLQSKNDLEIQKQTSRLEFAALATPDCKSHVSAHVCIEENLFYLVCRLLYRHLEILLKCELFSQKIKQKCHQNIRWQFKKMKRQLLTIMPSGKKCKNLRDQKLVFYQNSATFPRFNTVFENHQKCLILKFFWIFVLKMSKSARKFKCGFLNIFKYLNFRAKNDKV